MALTYVSLAPTVLMNVAGLSPLEFSIVFGANGFWIMAVSFVANRIIRKVGRPVCLKTGGILMFAGCLGLIAGITLVPPGRANRHLVIHVAGCQRLCRTGIPDGPGDQLRARTLLQRSGCRLSAGRFGTDGRWRDTWVYCDGTAVAAEAERGAGHAGGRMSGNAGASRQQKTTAI